MLTTDQLNFLKGHLNSINIKYEETFNEFLDHYATLTEQKIAEGVHFHDAWRLSLETMGGADKLRYLEEKSVEQWREQLSRRHWQIIRNCFRWPAIVSTVLVGVLVYQLLSMIGLRYFRLLTYGFIGLPMIYFLLFQYLPTLVAYWQGKRSRIHSLKDAIVAPNLNIIAFLLCIGNVLKDGLNETFTQTYSQLYQAFYLSLGFFLVIYSFSLFQLYQERLKISR